MSESTASKEGLVFLVYGSASLGPLDDRALQDLLRECRDKNARRGVTGLLLYRDENFLQVLEGPPDVVRPLYARICADGRHRGCVTFAEGALGERMFPEWSMAFRRAAHLTAEDRAAIDGWVAEAPRTAGGRPARVVETLVAVFQNIMR
ncbi:MAG: hypothetical protein JWM10_4011 [Myxococcaceae bacterium]|nr:hypothetical protein [Myxococcaceae bacterium]